MARFLPSGWTPRPIACVALVVTLALLAACGSHYGSHYGNLELRPGRYYPAPGPPGDPWGPYIRQVSQRFDVPQRWIRAVIQQESAGEVQALSPAGAMGLMQLMPRTYETLREEYGLGNDPFEPHDNIVAGTAYIRQMYQRYGAPGFLAAYNAGPERLDDYLANGDPLPAETVSYVSNVAPHLGSATPMTGPLSVYAGNNAAYTDQGGGCDLNAAYDPAHPCSVRPVPQAPVTLAATSRGYCDPNAAYDPDRPCMPAPRPMAPPAPVQMASNAPSGGCDPDAAYNPDQPCTPASAPVPRPVAPTPSHATASLLYQPEATQPVSTSNAVQSGSAAPPVQSGSTPGAFIPVEPTEAWAIQVGAFMTPSAAHAAAANARRALPALLTSAQVEVSTTEPFGSQVLFRARLTNLTADSAAGACSRLVQVRVPCLIVRPS